MDFRGGKAVGTYERDVLESTDVSNYSSLILYIAENLRASS
jgi:hypothetical protein